MGATLRYGSGSTLSLDVGPEVVVAECGLPDGEPLDDPAAATAAALDSPLDFPPLRRAIVPGDRIVIALDPSLPQAPSLAAGAVKVLLDAGAEPERIKLVQSNGNSRDVGLDPRRELARDIARRVELVTHDGTQRAELGYLAASKDGRPIYVNRVLLEADVVLPIACLEVRSTLSYHGAFSGLFPTFSDERTQRRFHTPEYRGSVIRRRRWKEVDEAGWLLGVSLMVQVVSGPGNSVLHVLAGGVDSLKKRGRQLCEAAWRYHLPRRSSLVVAGIYGDTWCQTWDSFGRALLAAMNVVTDGGAIVLCTDLAVQPEAALRGLVGADDFETASRNVRRHRSSDASAALALLRALENNQVFLLSRLDHDLVEELGMAPIDDVAEINRLVRHYPNCTMISNAQHTVPTVPQSPATNRRSRTSPIA
jgi:nickel-dependent lactate racemase